MAQALARAWAPTFALKEPDYAKANLMLDDHCTDYSHFQSAPPSFNDFQRAASRAKPSATGDDGIPYAAWTSRTAATTLALVADRLMSGQVMPREFNNSISIFPPKGDEEDDDTDLTRSPMNTRMLSLKNSDNKIIASVINRKMKLIVAETTNPIQRGFVSGRTFLTNVVDVDTYARIASMKQSPSDLAVMAFFDFAAAFPSVLHAWIFLVLAKSKWPLHLALSIS